MKLTESLTKSQSRLVRDNSDAARLISRSSLSEDGCWLWTGSAGGKGYGYMAFRGKTWRAHRVSYTLFHGEIPEGLFVCHHCDVPACVNPAHLFLGHATTNMKDMVRKGRARGLIDSDQSHFHAGCAPNGENASGAKLTEPLALKAIQMAASGALTKEIAERLSLNRTSIQRILRGETWSHLPRPSCLPRRQGAYGRAALSPSIQEAGE